MFERWKLKRKIRKAAIRLVDDAIDAYLDLSVREGPISTKVLWRKKYLSLRYDDLKETTITISTKTLYKKIAPYPPLPMPRLHKKPKDYGPARASDMPAPETCAKDAEYEYKYTNDFNEYQTLIKDGWELCNWAGEKAMFYLRRKQITTNNDGNDKDAKSNE